MNNYNFTQSLDGLNNIEADNINSSSVNFSSANITTLNNCNLVNCNTSTIPLSGNSIVNKIYVDSNFVDLSLNQTIEGIKTFSVFPRTNATSPTLANELIRKDYVDLNFVDKTTSQIISGVKNFTNNTQFRGTLTYYDTQAPFSNNSQFFHIGVTSVIKNNANSGIITYNTRTSAGVASNVMEISSSFLRMFKPIRVMDTNAPLTGYTEIVQAGTLLSFTPSYNLGEYQFKTRTSTGTLNIPLIIDNDGISVFGTTSCAVMEASQYRGTSANADLTFGGTTTSGRILIGGVINGGLGGEIQIGTTLSTNNINGTTTFSNNCNFNSILSLKNKKQLNETQNIQTSTTISLSFPLQETTVIRSSAGATTITVVLPTITVNEVGLLFNFFKFQTGLNVIFQSASRIYTLNDLATGSTTNTTLLSSDKLTTTLMCNSFGTLYYWVEVSNYSTFDRDYNNTLYARLASPNAFTNTNTFNSFLPTSTLTPSSPTELTTKAYVDGMPVHQILNTNNIWTGTNTFNTYLPTSTITPSAPTQLITKSYADGKFIDFTTDQTISALQKRFNGIFCTSLNITPTLGGAGNRQQMYITGQELAFVPLFTSNYYRFYCRDAVYTNQTNPFEISSATTIVRNSLNAQGSNTFGLSTSDTQDIMGWLYLRFRTRIYDLNGLGNNTQLYMINGNEFIIAPQQNNQMISFYCKDASSNGINTFVSSALANTSNVNLICNSTLTSNNLTSPTTTSTNNIYTNLITGGIINIGAIQSNINIKSLLNFNEAYYGTSQTTTVYMEGNSFRFGTNGTTGGNYIFTINETIPYNILILNKTSVDIAGDVNITGNLILYDTTPSTKTISMSLLNNDVILDPLNTVSTTYNFKTNDSLGMETTPLTISTSTTTIQNSLISNGQATFNNFTPISSVANPTANNHLTRKDYVDNNFMQKTNNVQESISGWKTFNNRVDLNGGTALVVGTGTSTFGGTSAFNNTATFATDVLFSADTININGTTSAQDLDFFTSITLGTIHLFSSLSNSLVSMFNYSTNDVILEINAKVKFRQVKLYNQVKTITSTTTLTFPLEETIVIRPTATIYIELPLITANSLGMSFNFITNSTAYAIWFETQGTDNIIKNGYTTGNTSTIVLGTNGITSVQLTCLELSAGVYTWSFFSSLPEKVSNPPGTIITMAVQSTPLGYLACDGGSYSFGGIYSNLYAVIGTTYGTGGTGTFRVPNFNNGSFLRGVGGNAGAIATQQQDNIKTHTHNTTFYRFNNGSGGGGTDVISDLASGSVGSTVVSSSTNTAGSPDETRPINYAVHYCIKY